MEHLIRTEIKNFGKLITIAKNVTFVHMYHNNLFILYVPQTCPLQYGSGGGSTMTFGFSFGAIVNDPATGWANLLECSIITKLDKHVNVVVFAMCELQNMSQSDV